MTFKVFVDGQEGTTGLQINEYLAQRSDVEVLAIDPALRKDEGERRRLINASDVTFLCLPDEAARQAAGLVENPRTCIIDASTAHRVDPAWTFGLPELAPGQREKIRAAKRISNPGCHATAYILAVRPLVDAGLIAADTQLAATSITGYSGGGKKMIEQYRSGAVSSAPRPYALSLVHKHLPEMAVYTGLAKPPVFQPIVGPFHKGLAVSVFLHPGQMTRAMGPGELRELLATHYRDEAFVRVAPFDLEASTDGGFFDVEGSNGSNRVDLFVFGNAERMLVVARIDNLGKGASGAAVQSMNIHMGVDEATGL